MSTTALEILSDVANNSLKPKSVKAFPGGTMTFSPKRAIGLTGARMKFARKTGIPTTKQGLERKIGRIIMDLILGLFFGKK